MTDSTRDMELLNTFVKSAQYILGLSTRQDLWEHVGRLIVTYFHAAWTTFVQQDAQGVFSVDHCTPASAAISEHVLKDPARSVIKDVLESGFLASQVIPTPEPSMTVFLPIAGAQQPRRVLLIGHQTAAALPGDLLNIYLAVAGLAGAMMERLHVERELDVYRAHLEELVKARTSELAEAKRQNELILDSIGEGIMGVDAQERISFVNPAACQLTGWPACELIGRNAHETFHHTKPDGSAYPAEPCAIHDTLKQGQTHSVGEARFFRKDGSDFPVEFKTSPVMEADRIVGAVLVFRDVTVQRRAQQEREITIRFLHLVNESTGAPELVRAATGFFQSTSGCEAVGIRLRQGDDYPYYETRGFPAEFVLAENSLCARDSDGQVRRDSAGNPVLECMCGNVIRGRFDPSKPFFTPRGSFWTNSTTQLLSSTSQADRQARTRNRCHSEGYESVALIALRLGEARLGLLQLNDRRRGIFSAESIGLWERLGDHLAVALAKFRAEEDLRRTAEDLARSNTDLEQFAYVSSHDLQEPLRMVTGFMQLFAKKYQDKLDADGETYIHYAVDGAKRMQQLIDDLLAYSRVGTQGKKLSTVDCAAALKGALANLHVSIQEAGAEVTHGDLPTILADRTQLTQLFQNLIGNAIKFRSEQPPKIRVDACLDGNRWTFSVRDNGIGIAPEYHDRIFIIFQRLHGKQEYPGTGIGLAVCKRIVERHGGRIWLESKPGEGTTFFFDLPAGGVA